jgi:hypothetical protein
MEQSGITTAIATQTEQKQARLHEAGTPSNLPQKLDLREQDQNQTSNKWQARQSYCNSRPTSKVNLPKQQGQKSL